MAKKIYKIKNFSGGLNSFQTPSDISESQVSDAKSIMFTKQGSIEPSYIMTDTTNNKISAYNNTNIGNIEPGYGLGYFETDYQVMAGNTVSEAGNGTSTGFIFAALGQSNELGCFDSLGVDSDLASSFPIGSEIAITGLIGDGATGAATADLNGLFKVSSHSGTVLKLNRPLIIGGDDYYFTATVTGYPQGDKIILLANPSIQKIDIYSLGGAVWVNNAIILSDLTLSYDSKVKYYKVEDSIRVCDTTDNSVAKIKWYGWTSRSHFNGTVNANVISRFTSSDNTLLPPTNGDLTATGTATHPLAGAGFDLDIASDTSTDGVISSGVYEFAQTFIYDGNQESLPYKYTSTYEVTSANDLKSLSVNIGLQGDYANRISGGRIYIREEKSKDEWILLIDIDLQKGCRTNLAEEYTLYHHVSGNNFLCPDSTSANNFIIDEFNIVNYEILNGFPSSVFSIDMGHDEEKWKDSIVANNRVFVCNVNIRDENKGVDKASASSTHFPDRIMYSMSGRYDTFPYFNFIEAAKGDSDHYMAIDSYADRLFAFKRFSVDIINIASPDDYNWFMEDSKKYMGIDNPESVKKTQHGLIWINENGMFKYDGSSIKNVSENLIDNDDWASHVASSTNSGIIYDERESLAFIIKNMDSDGDAYAFDMKKNTFTFIPDFAPVPITNSVDTESGQTFVAKSDGTQTDIYQLYRDYQATSPILWQSKEIDFGDPNVNKRFYAMYMTYKTSTDLSAKIWYSLNGGSTWTVMSGTNTTGTSAWIKGKWTPSSTISVSKIMFKIDIPSTDAKLWINDIGLEYREIHKRMA